MDFRTVSRRVPESLFEGGECRIYLGEAESRRERQVLEHRREVLKKLARRGDWTTLRRIKDRELTVEEVVAAADRVGLDAMEAELRPDAHAPPMAEEVDRWLATLTGKTATIYRGCMERIVELLPDGLSPHEVGRHHVRQMMDALRAEGLAQNTRASHQTALSSFFTWWVDEEEAKAEQEGRAPLLSVNPVHKTRRVQAVATRHRFLTEEEYETLVAGASPEMEAVYATLTFCGLRIRELFHLRPVDVDLPTHVRIRARDGWAPKGFERWGVGEGDIPIHRTRLLPLLERHAKLWAGDDYFFLNPRTGERWRYPAFREQMRRDCAVAGIPYGRDEPGGITPHTFRHTLASWLARRDVQLMKIAQLLRERVETVSKHYAHLLPGDLDTTLNEVL